MQAKVHTDTHLEEIVWDEKKERKTEETMLVTQNQSICVIFYHSLTLLSEK